MANRKASREAIFFLFRIVCFFLSLLPLKLELFIGKYLGKAAYYLLSKERIRSIRNLDIAFKDKGFPSDVAATEVSFSGENISIIELLSDASNILASRGEAKRKVREGAVEIDGTRVSDGNLTLSAGKEYKVRVGKKFAKIILKKC